MVGGVGVPLLVLTRSGVLPRTTGNCTARVWDLGCGAEAAARLKSGEPKQDSDQGAGSCEGREKTGPTSSSGCPASIARATSKAQEIAELGASCDAYPVVVGGLAPREVDAWDEERLAGQRRAGKAGEGGDRRRRSAVEGVRVRWCVTGEKGQKTLRESEGQKP